jgi:hypothetical protein
MIYSLKVFTNGVCVKRSEMNLPLALSFQL